MPRGGGGGGSEKAKPFGIELGQVVSNRRIQAMLRVVGQPAEFRKRRVEKSRGVSR